MEKVDTRIVRLHDQVVRAIALRILVINRDSEDPILPTEMELSLELNVSRNVVREAAKVLASKGLIEIRPKTGMRIRNHSDWNLFDTDMLNWQFEVGPDEKFFRDLYDLRSVVEPAAAERAEREIVRLERRIAGLGPVNALAPEQHEVLNARVITIAIQRDDLAGACSELRAMARQLESEIEQRFDTVFGAVSFHFQELYAELFPGGKATLRLEEPEPMTLEIDAVAPPRAQRRPGVEILAQPPGKRQTPLRLLSGGERALTALAVVLALQQVNPSPFYVFDEVDAALDDSNVLRFTRLLRRLGAEQQFLVVTHNHITMAAADALWGVTIDADGTSSVLGVRFDEAEVTATPTVKLHRVAG